MSSLYPDFTYPAQFLTFRHFTNGRNQGFSDRPPNFSLLGIKNATPEADYKAHETTTNTQTHIYHVVPAGKNLYFQHGNKIHQTDI